MYAYDAAHCFKHAHRALLADIFRRESGREHSEKFFDMAGDGDSLIAFHNMGILVPGKTHLFLMDMEEDKLFKTAGICSQLGFPDDSVTLGCIDIYDPLASLQLLVSNQKRPFDLVNLDVCGMASDKHLDFLARNSDIFKSAFVGHTICLATQFRTDPFSFDNFHNCPGKNWKEKFQIRFNSSCQDIDAENTGRALYSIHKCVEALRAKEITIYSCYREMKRGARPMCFFITEPQTERATPKRQSKAAKKVSKMFDKLLKKSLTELTEMRDCETSPAKKAWITRAINAKVQEIKTKKGGQ